MPTYEIDATITAKARLWVPATSIEEARVKLDAATPRQLRDWTTARFLTRSIDLISVNAVKIQTDFVR